MHIFDILALIYVFANSYEAHLFSRSSVPAYINIIFVYFCKLFVIYLGDRP